MGTYHGGKVRIGEKLSEHIVSLMKKSGKKYTGYCEPFCGFCGVYRHIPDMFEEEFDTKFTYSAGDANGSVIKMWKGLQGTWNPPLKCSKARFESLKYDGKESAEKGLVGHACSYRGDYFTTYFDKRPLENTSLLFKEFGHEELSDVNFTHGSYTQFSHLRNFVIYCDPPYKSNSHYFDEKHKMKTFDINAFTDWCKTMKRKGNLIIISENGGGMFPFREIPVGGRLKESIYIP
jgi:site-specific DNA-adenine methylase